jgi:hypothetical protein
MKNGTTDNGNDFCASMIWLAAGLLVMWLIFRVWGGGE